MFCTPKYISTKVSNNVHNISDLEHIDKNPNLNDPLTLLNNNSSLNNISENNTKYLSSADPSLCSEVKIETVLDYDQIDLYSPSDKIKGLQSHCEDAIDVKIEVNTLDNLPGCSAEPSLKATSSAIGCKSVSIIYFSLQIKIVFLNNIHFLIFNYEYI